MSHSDLVLVADRHRLDAELLANHLGICGLVEDARANDLVAMDLSSVSLVLLDSECDEAAFHAACAGAAAVGLLYTTDSPTLRSRATRPAVRLVAPRTTSIEALRRLVMSVLEGGRQRRLPRDVESLAKPTLSPRETEVLTLMAQGLANREIATRLDISPHTVRTHVQSVLSKFNKDNRVSAVGAARVAGLLSQ